MEMLNSATSSFIERSNGHIWLFGVICQMYLLFTTKGRKKNGNFGLKHIPRSLSIRYLILLIAIGRRRAVVPSESDHRSYQ